MKRVAQVLVISSLLVSMAACEPVQSVYPFFDPKDVVFDSQLLGQWMAVIDEDAWTLSFAEKDNNSNAYTVRWAVRVSKPQEGDAEDVEWTLEGNLFHVGDARYLDVRAERFSVKPHGRVLDWEVGSGLFAAPTHTVYRVKLDGDHLALFFLDDDNVKNFIKKNKLTLAIDQDHFLLTGTPQELQAQLLSQAEKEGLLDEDGIEFVRQK